MSSKAYTGTPRRKRETVAFLEKTITNKAFKDAIDAISVCHRTSGLKPKSMLLVGPSGVGKSTIVSKYRDRFPKTEYAEYTCQPVIYGSLQPRVTVKDMLSVLLEAVGDPKPTSGTQQALINRLCTLIQGTNVQLIILDEIHHVLPSHSHHKTQHAADLLKSLTDYTQVPFVLVGLPKARDLLENPSDATEDQLRRRFRKPVELRPPKLGSQAWDNLLEAYQTILGIPCIRLNGEEMKKRMFLATRGLHGRISNLLEEAIELSDGAEQLTQCHFAKAYLESVSVHDLNGNPFDIPLPKVERFLTEVGAVL
ncbi:MAG: TniB family NTP-binding protein [Thiogranum sp.]|nr:TniB family NTP-binding protein [Thiogranum sp.]